MTEIMRFPLNIGENCLNLGITLAGSTIAGENSTNRWHLTG